MNWYKKRKIIEANWSWAKFLALPLLTLAVMAGISRYALDDLLKKHKPDEVKTMLVQRIQEKNTSQTPPVDTTSNTQAPVPPETQPEAVGNVREMIERHEGRRNNLYYVNGIPHIGVGFNLTRPDARQLLERIGANYSRIRNGQSQLSNEQVDRLFDITLNEASSTARQLVDNFDNLPLPARNVVTNMAFNMGGPRLSGFREFRRALEQQDFERAAREMEDSIWHRDNQVGERSQELINIMRQTR